MHQILGQSAQVSCIGYKEKNEGSHLIWPSQCGPMCPNGPGVPHEASTGSPTHYNVQIRESPAKWPLHCTSLYFNAQTRVSCDISFSKTDGDALCENI